MREQLEVLVSLQELDREIKTKKESKEEFLEEIRAREEEMETKRSDGGGLRSAWMEKDQLRQDKERTLQEESRKASDKRMRMSQIKSIKELQALQREIDQVKQGNSQLEETLIGIMEELEIRSAALKEKEEELETLDQGWKGRREELEAQIAKIDKGVTEVLRLREETAARLNGDLIGRYEMIFSRRGGVAVVEVSDGICSGCHMNIPPQLWNEVIRSDKVNLCPSCHRILYYTPPVSGNPSA
ncbi:MAG: C4-type zinc ribbon domain-containing protein [Candidatus Binatia bacterium]|nr:C4-type zinc ribbon domain-containing protein [Candidatus Binatia bacterium]